MAIKANLDLSLSSMLDEIKEHMKRGEEWHRDAIGDYLVAITNHIGFPQDGSMHPAREPDYLDILGRVTVEWREACCLRTPSYTEWFLRCEMMKPFLELVRLWVDEYEHLLKYQPQRLMKKEVGA